MKLNFDYRLDLRLAQPHASLKAHLHQPEALRRYPAFACADQHLQAEVLAASRKVTSVKKGGMKTVVIGPSAFNDVPLEHLLRAGQVAGIDLHEAAMTSGKEQLGPDLAKRLALHPFDASLCYSEMFRQVEATLDRHPHLSTALMLELFDLLNIINQQLATIPGFLSERSVDFFISISTMSGMTVSAYNFFVGLLNNKYGELNCLQFLLHQKVEGQLLGLTLSQRFSQLYWSVMDAQIKWAGAALHPGGVAFISDHYFYAQTEGFGEGEVLIYKGSSSPCNPQQTKANARITAFAWPYLKFPAMIGKRETRMQIEGDKTLAAIAQNQGWQLLDRFCFWNIISSDQFGEQVEASFDEAIVISRPA